MLEGLDLVTGESLADVIEGHCDVKVEDIVDILEAGTTAIF